ncbi:MAG TPA: RDD family protein [Blastocatellia bacterium]|nr:RDD family protein [Blastocatellia bacterium]
MTKFCPYCGKRLNTRSKFCPKCGKQRLDRQSLAVGLADDQSSARTTGNSGLTDSARLQRNFERASLGEHQDYTREGRARTVTTTPRPNGSPRAARYAPATHSLIGYSEQAGFGLRYGAWMFDFLITLIGMMVFTFAVTAASRRSVVGSNTDLAIVAALTLLMFLLNFVVLAGIGGQTAGMRILGIFIVRVDGRPFTMKQAALRHLVGYPLSTASFFLGFLWMLWDPRQQGWHDKLARTIVVMSK